MSVPASLWLRDDVIQGRAVPASVVRCVCARTCVFLLWCVQCVNKAEQEGFWAYHKEMVKGQHPSHVAE